MNREQLQKSAEELARKLTDEGKLIEVGWQTMRLLILPPNLSPEEISGRRTAFFMGAQHLYASIMGIMDPGTEVTDKDLDRMSLIHNELEAFRMEVTSMHKPGSG